MTLGEQLDSAFLRGYKGRAGGIISKRVPQAAKLPPGAFSKLYKAVGPVGALIAGSLAAAAVIGVGSKLNEKRTRKADFSNALKESPRLQKNPAQAYKHFMTLRRLNKKLTDDPMTAAGYMNKALAFEDEGIDPSIPVALMDKSSLHGKSVFDAAKIAALAQHFAG